MKLELLAGKERLGVQQAEHANTAKELAKARERAEASKEEVRTSVPPPPSPPRNGSGTPPPLAHARPCLSTGWALNRRFEETLGPLFLWSKMEDWVSVERLYRERGAHP